MEAYDVVVIGGGITGAGILRDCALRGLKALLLEKAAPGRATTAASTHLIHGGLRYLLYDRLTTHTTSWDSGNIVRIARPLLRRLPILWPLYKGQRHGPETVETLLETYDAFQPMKCGLGHLRLGAAETASLVPGLRAEGLLGSVSFDEWWVDAEGLVEANLAQAGTLGAQTRLGARVTGLLREGARVRGVKADIAGSSTEIGAGVVINAAGPWIDKVGAMAGISIPLRLRQGTHLVYEKQWTPLGLLLEAPDGERVVFVVPFPGGTLVGPTDIPAAEDPDRLKAGDEEIRYLLATARGYLPSLPEGFSRTTVGARPILGQRGSEKLLSREYHIFDHAAESGVEGFVTAGGGKMSDFRLMAKDAVDLACAKLGRPGECRTHRLTLSGEDLPPPPVFPRPWRPLVQFLSRHPHLREAHAMAYLAGAFARHSLRRVSGARRTTLAEFRAHYGL